jgi:hypothetical protein
MCDNRYPLEKSQITLRFKIKIKEINKKIQTTTNKYETQKA